jgi:long-subunit acyl-CoA synthetase (AMP-forming)
VEAELAHLLQEVNDGLADYERLRMLVVAREPWTIESGCLTPTLKVRRAAIEARVAPHLDGWYASDRPVLWM